MTDSKKPAPTGHKTWTPRPAAPRATPFDGGKSTPQKVSDCILHCLRGAASPITFRDLQFALDDKVPSAIRAALAALVEGGTVTVESGSYALVSSP